MGAGPIVRLSTLQSDEGDRVLDVVEDRLTRFVFVDNDRKRDVAELQFWDADMALLDDPAFRTGQKLLVTWGWAGNLAPPRRMIVARPKDANTIKLLDEAVLMDRQRQRRVWHDAMDSDVVQEIAAGWGYEGILADITPTFVRRPAVTQNTSDARMLQRLARRNAYVWYVDAAGLHFHPRRMDLEPSRMFIYRNDPGLGDVLTRPQIEGNVLDVSKVRVEARDPVTKELFAVEAGVTTTEDDATLGGYLTNFVALGDEEEIGDPDNPDGSRQARAARAEVISMGYASREEAEQEAVARYIETAQGRYRMSCTVRGDPQVGAKQLHYWRLPSEAYSGLYYCTEARTEITPGSYKITLSYRKDALGRLGTSKILPVGRKKNKKEPELDENGAPVDTHDLDQILTWTEENGEAVPAVQFKEKGTGGDNVGQAQVLTAQQWADIPAAERADFLSKHGQGLTLPGE